MLETMVWTCTKCGIYKTTEVSVTPPGWDAKKTDEIFNRTGTARPQLMRRSTCNHCAEEKRRKNGADHTHLDDQGKFVCDKYKWCPPGYFVLKFEDHYAQMCLELYAALTKDAQLAADLRAAIKTVRDAGRTKLPD